MISRIKTWRLCFDKNIFAKQINFDTLFYYVVVLCFVFFFMYK